MRDLPQNFSESLERKTHYSGYYDYVLNHAFLLIPAQQYVADFLDSFKEFPPRQKAASFSIDQALEVMKKNPGG